MEEGAELGDYRLTAADHMICSIYGDHPHHNDVTHLYEGFLNNAVWQHHWRRIRNFYMRWYQFNPYVLTFCTAISYIGNIYLYTQRLKIMILLHTSDTPR